MYKTQRELACTRPVYYITLKEYSFLSEEVVGYFESANNENARESFIRSCRNSIYWDMCIMHLFFIDSDRNVRWIATRDPCNDFLQRWRPKVVI